MNGLLKALLLVLAAQSAVERTAARIEGVVVAAANGEPIVSAGVELIPASGTSKAIAAGTAADGRFVFNDVAAGDYRLAATHIGYVRSEYGQRGPNGQGIVIRVAAGQTIRDTRISLTQTGAVYGRITDRNGAPAANVEVRALKRTYQNGRRVLSSVKTVRTNDLGEYRLFWLPPDRYYLSATPLKGEVSDVMDNGNAAMRPVAGHQIVLPGDEAMATFYYPASTDPLRASAIDLRPADNLGGMDFRVFPVVSRKLSGMVVVRSSGVNAQAKVSPSFGEVQLQRSDSEASPVSVSKTLRGKPDPKTGVFEIRGVLPGSYVASILGSINGAAAHGSVPVEIGEADLENVTIELVPGSGIPVKASGEDGRTINTSIVRVSNESALDGIAVNEEVQFQPNVKVVLVPESSLRDQWGLYRDTTTDAAGRFRIAGLTPGNYKVFAWEDVQKGAWQDPEFIRVYEDNGVAISIEEGSRATVRVTMIPLGR
jgi:hypothetical protein